MRVRRASQRGVSLSGLIVWLCVIAIAVTLGFKIVPDVIEYWSIKKAIAEISHDSKLNTVSDVRREFDRYADINSISTISFTHSRSNFNSSFLLEEVDVAEPCINPGSILMIGSANISLLISSKLG